MRSDLYPIIGLGTRHGLTVLWLPGPMIGPILEVSRRKESLIGISLSLIPGGSHSTVLRLSLLIDVELMFGCCGDRKLAIHEAAHESRQL